MLLAFLFPIEGYREVTREDMREERRAKEGGKGDGGCPFVLPPLLSLCSPLEKESLLAD